jgi:hypothetical protein
MIAKTVPHMVTSETMQVDTDGLPVMVLALAQQCANNPNQYISSLAVAIADCLGLIS